MPPRSCAGPDEKQKGNVYLVGFCTGIVDFGGGIVAGVPGASSALTKLDGAGNAQWSRTFTWAVEAIRSSTLLGCC